MAIFEFGLVRRGRIDRFGMGERGKTWGLPESKYPRAVRGTMIEIQMTKKTSL